MSLDDHPARIRPFRPISAAPFDDGRLDSLVSPPSPPPKFKSAAVFIDEFVPPSYTLEPVVRTGSIYTATAKTGSGKTALLIAVMLAVATGNGALVGMEVEQGRVAYVVIENPDDFRMRLMVAAFCANIDLAALGAELVILDRWAKPEDIIESLDALARQRPFQLIIIDTLAALFDGDDMNASVQGGNFMRRLRGLTTVAGRPSVLVAAHPTKSAEEGNLLPYGSGAILNEVDGNLTLWKRADGLIDLHWQGKLRGLEFAPRPFRIDLCRAPGVVDRKDRQVAMPVMTPTSGADIEARRNADADVKIRLLKAMIADPNGTLDAWGKVVQRAKSSISGLLKSLEKKKYVEHGLGKWRVTSKGEKEAEGAS